MIVKPKGSDELGAYGEYKERQITTSLLTGGTKVGWTSRLSTASQSIDAITLSSFRSSKVFSRLLGSCWRSCGTMINSWLPWGHWGGVKLELLHINTSLVLLIKCCYYYPDVQANLVPLLQYYPQLFIMNYEHVINGLKRGFCNFSCSFASATDLGV